MVSEKIKTWYFPYYYFPYYSQIIGGDPDVDHTQIIGGDRVKIFGGYIPPSSPGFGTPGRAPQL